MGPGGRPAGVARRPPTVGTDDEPSTELTRGWSRALVLVGLVMWLVQPAWLLVEALVVSAVEAPYELLHNTISDLGAVSCTTIAYPSAPVPVCSPLHGVLNGSFVIFGLLLAAGSVLIAPLLPRGRTRAWAVGLWIVAGLSSVATGLVPLDVDLVGHYVVSAPAFLAQPAAVLLTGLLLRRRHRAVGWSGVLLGTASLLVGLVFTVRVDTAEYGGLLERAVLWPAFVWSTCAALAIRRDLRDLRDLRDQVTTSFGRPGS